MQWGGLYFVSLAICCLHTASEPLPSISEYSSNVRSRRSDDKDSLALSREIFRNITKQLRENIGREGSTDKNDLLPGKVEESRQYLPFQGYHDHHHEHHWGPSFEDEKYTQVTAHVGSEALLNCRVIMLKDKTVTWMRNSTDSAQLLTVGPAAYTGDNRIAMKFQYPNNWRLSMNPVKRSDAGNYMCQIATHPPRTIFVNLTVLPPVLTINNDQTYEMKDRFYKAGSSINLACIISEDYVLTLPTKAPNTTPLPTTTEATTTTELTTKKFSTVLNRIEINLNKSWSVETTTLSTTVSLSTTTKAPETTIATTVKTTVPAVVNNIYGLVWKKQGKEYNDNVTWRNMSATINVASASQNDSGTYTCLLQNHSQVTVNVHVISGENQAAVHLDTWNKGTLFWQPQSVSLINITAIFLFLTRRYV
ncbi:cell adhesion molecule 3-like [Plodia interpunctella]|uniref:cell adhesion molecule 3-like n=1 Tax=Plodia interpunctella TaxID=58824 RepID=UPI0023685041|nr:cell adhesion molecule 3-like [Plodia interpunctella]XP_053611431.1 cell adhesion molecule 3-like [Plodia interpunctella]